MEPFVEKALFDLMESEADVLYYIRDAEKPAIIIISSPVGHLPIKAGDKFTLWFGNGIERFSFKNQKLAEAKAVEILKTAACDMFVRVEYPKKRGKDETKKLWFQGTSPVPRDHNAVVIP